MIVCPSCSNESPDDSAFCGFCGHKYDARGPRKTLFAFKPIIKASGAAESDDAAGAAGDSASSASSASQAAPAPAGGPRLSRRKPQPSDGSGPDVETDWATLNLMSLPSLETIGSKRARASKAKAQQALGEQPTDTERTESVPARTMPTSDDAVAAVPDVGPTEVDLGHGPGVASAAELDEGVAAGGEARLRSGVRGTVDRGEPSVVPDAALDDEARRQPPDEATPKRKKKPVDRNSTFVMEGPVGGDIPAAGHDRGHDRGHDKDDEKSFFGASLSQHGMAPVEESRPSERRGNPLVMLVIAVIVIGAIVAAVVLLTG